MASIYAAAQLVFITAGASDAYFSLPISQRGVAPEIPPGFVGRRGDHPHPEEIGNVELRSCGIPLTYSSIKYGLGKWSKRAWTFQECYFARRRLFFASDQVVYKCNDDSELSDIPEWFPSRDNSHISAAKRIISGYSGRKLTFESDAFAAVVGALQGDGSQRSWRHIWGLPLQDGSQSLTSEASVALFWIQDYGERRHGFPS